MPYAKVKISSLDFPIFVRVVATGTCLPTNQLLIATQTKEEKGIWYIWINKFQQWYQSNIFRFDITTKPN